jgi:hypothetical protein
MGKTKVGGYLIQYAAVEAICRNKVNYFVNRDELSLYTEDLVTIMQIEIYHKRWKMPAE